MRSMRRHGICGTAQPVSRRSAVLVFEGKIPPGVAMARKLLEEQSRESVEPDVADVTPSSAASMFAALVSADGAKLPFSPTGLDSSSQPRPLSGASCLFASLASTPAAGGSFQPPGEPVSSGADASTNPRPTRRRQMGPLVPPPKRAKGSLAEALKVAGSPQTMEVAKCEYEEAVYAPQTFGAKLALRSTWSKIAVKLGFEPIPLSAQSLHAVSAALKYAGYKAAPAYICEAVQWHRRAGYEVSEQLELAVKDAKRAVSRAVGPPKRAAEIKLDWFCRLEHRGLDPAERGWPIDRYPTWIVGFHFVLREVELSCLFLSDVQLDWEHRCVTLSLPVSKSDPAGRGCRRTLACDCDGSGSLTCPFCMAARLFQGQEQRLKCLGQEGKDTWPLVGRADNPGTVVSKIDFIDALRWDASVILKEFDCAQTLEPSDVSGHSLRRSGCKALARRGVPLELIQYMSRHSSSAVLGYVEEAHEESPQYQHRLHVHLELRDQISALVAKTNCLEEALRKAKEHYEGVAAQWSVPLDRDAVLKVFDQWARPAVVTDEFSKKIHATAGNNFRLPPAEWATACGWKWVVAGRIAKACMEGPDIPIDFVVCDRCKGKLPEWATDQCQVLSWNCTGGLGSWDRLLALKV